MLKFPPDITFVIQIVSFLLLWAALKRLAWDPILQVLEERDARTRGGLAEAEKMRAEVDAAQADYEAKLREARQEAAKEVDAARKAAEALQNEELANARASAERELATMRAGIAAQVAQARTTLADDARGLGTLMVERVTGRKLAS